MLREASESTDWVYNAIRQIAGEVQRKLFRNTADKMGLHDAIVEKDFWVCFTLDYLFHRSPWKDSITFKGGTGKNCLYTT